MLHACLNAFCSPVPLTLCMSPIFICCLCHSLPIPSIFFVQYFYITSPLHLCIFFLKKIKIKYYYLKFIFCPSDQSVSLPLQVSALFSFSLSLTLSVPTFFVSLFHPFLLNSSFAQSILIKGNFSLYVSLLILEGIAYLCFSLHPPILLLLLSVVKIGVSIVFIAPLV